MENVWKKLMGSCFGTDSRGLEWVVVKMFCWGLRKPVGNIWIA